MGPWENFYDVDDEDRYDYPIHYGGSGDVPDPWITLFRGHELMGVRPSVRDTVYEQAALQPAPKLIEDIRRAFEQAERERLTDSGDWQQIAQSYERDAKLEHERADNAEKRLVDIERKLDQEKNKSRKLQRALERQGQRSATMPVASRPEGISDPKTVIDALHQATQTCQSLVFGKDVWDSANKIEPEPALARKVLIALQALNEGTDLAAEDRLDTALTSWIHENRGIESSPDNEPRRLKDDSGRPREFSMHLKLKEATAANKAVRIYFEHLPDEGKTLVGYIGPHL